MNATEVKALATQLGLNLDPLELLRAENPKDSATPSTQDILERRLTAAHGAKVATAFRLGYSLAAVFYHSAAPGQDETFIVSQYRHLAPQMNKAMVDLGIQYAFDPALNSPSAISAAAKKGRDMVDSGFRQ